MIKGIYLIGCGGVGSQLAGPLSRLIAFHPRSKDATLYLIDGDVIEDSNLSRQVYSSDDIGCNKAQALANDLLKCKSLESRVAVVDDYIARNKLKGLLKTQQATDSINIIIAAVDNYATRSSIMRMILEEEVDNILLMTPGNDLSDGQLLTWGKINGQLTGASPLDYPEYKTPSDQVPRKGGMGCGVQAISSPQLISANALGAVATLCNMQKLLDTGKVWGEMYFDIYKGVLKPYDEATIFSTEELSAQEPPEIVFVG